MDHRSNFRTVDLLTVRYIGKFIDIDTDYVRLLVGPSYFLLHPDLRDKAGCVSYVRQRRTTHIMTKCIEINITNIINIIII
jgi:hypothetical protein